MKRHLLLFFLFWVSVAVWAQKELRIAPYFDTDFARQHNATLVRREGKVLADYRLSLFHSLTVKLGDEQSRQLENALRTDTRTALHREEGYKRTRLYYGLYQLPALTKGQHRYLFYRNNGLRQGANPQVTLIYMTGSATLSELKQTFGTP